MMNIEEVKGAFETVDLSTINHSQRLFFSRAEIVTKTYSPLALIRYKIDGVEERLGLRLDLDKGIFLDYPCINDSLKAIARKRASDIAEYIGSELLRRKNATNSCSTFG